MTHEHTPQLDQELEQRLASRLLDVLIRAGLILALAMLCYQVFAPFLTLMVWALMLAVTLYPLHQSLARKIGGNRGSRQRCSSWSARADRRADGGADEFTGRLGAAVRHRRAGQHPDDSAAARRRRGLADGREQAVRAVVTAHTDLPALVQSMQPKIGDLAKAALGFVAGIGGGSLQFLARSSSRGSSWPSASRAIAAAARSSGASSAPNAARNSPICRRRRSVPSRWA